jgi:hypothetical protein
MLKVRFLPVVLLSLVFVLPVVAAPKRKSYPMNVPAAAVRKIVFDVQEGNFSLRGDPDAKEIRMQVSIDRTWVFKLGEQDILKRLIKVSGAGTPEVTIRTEIPRGITSFGRAEYPIDFEIVVPERAALEVHDTSGNIEITAMQAPVDVQDSSGTVAVWGVRGDLRLRKESGDVKIEDVSGQITLENHSGQMQLRRLGHLDVQDSNGNLAVTGATSAKVRSRGGNLRVSDVSGDLEVDNEAGEIVISRVSGNVTVRDTSGQIRTQDTGALTIRDTSGDITVRRAASLQVVEKESGQIAVGGVAGAVTVPPGFTAKTLR